MRSPKDMRIIQIDITNACSLSCSNCTRFCGNHKKPFFMDEETFKQAVDSLVGFERTIGIMGGEPTLHPKFEVFARYLTEKHSPKYHLNALRHPVRNFISYIRDKNYFWDESLNLRKGPGLWTAIGKKYYEYFELIQDTFSFQLINDHMNGTLHQPMLVSRKDMGISDCDWIPLRDKCWVQNMWSATITPKGAFFCEIAGALDMLFDGPGGWPIEPNWWKRKPEEFGEQLNWCELCGATLSTKGRLSTDGIDDVSTTLFDMLIKIDSPKVKQSRVSLLNPEKIGEINMPDTISRYIKTYNERISAENRSLFPRHLSKYRLDDHTKQFDVSMLMNDSGGDWILLYVGDEPVNLYLTEIHQYIFNPGMLYIINKYSILFNIKAMALRGISGIFDINSFINLWPSEKQIKLTDESDVNIANPDFLEWVRFTKNNNLQTEAVCKSLTKIATDYGIIIEL